jgi:hypothetical protein
MHHVFTQHMSTHTLGWVYSRSCAVPSCLYHKVFIAKGCGAEGPTGNECLQRVTDSIIRYLPTVFYGDVIRDIFFFS